MGWTGYRGMTRQQALAAHLADVKQLAGPVDRGGHVWVMGETIDTHQPMIVVVLVDDNYLKEVDETMGPLVFDCPLEWLDRVPEAPGAFAREWRERVRDHWLVKGREVLAASQALADGR